VITLEVVEKKKGKPKIQRIPSKAINEDGFPLMKRKSSFFLGERIVTRVCLMIKEELMMVFGTRGQSSKIPTTHQVQVYNDDNNDTSDGHVMDKTNHMCNYKVVNEDVACF